MQCRNGGLGERIRPLWIEDLTQDTEFSLPNRIRIIRLALSSQFDAGATTAQLAAPSGKSSGANFQAGRIEEAVSAVASVMAGDAYTEDEWSIIVTSFAANGDVYEFRVTNGGIPYGTYTVTPQLTVGAGGIVVANHRRSPLLAI